MLNIILLEPIPLIRAFRSPPVPLTANTNRSPEPTASAQVGFLFGIFKDGFDDPMLDDSQIFVAVLQHGSVKRHP